MQRRKGKDLVKIDTLISVNEMTFILFLLLSFCLFFSVAFFLFSSSPYHVTFITIMDHRRTHCLSRLKLLGIHVTN